MAPVRGSAATPAGLDLAADLGRQPWMTAAAARVLAGLLLPAGATAQMLLDETGLDQITMIAKATRRIPLTAAESTRAGGPSTPSGNLRGGPGQGFRAAGSQG